MIDLDELGYTIGVHPQDLVDWQELVASGIGYSRVSIPQKNRRPREVLRPSIELDRILKLLSLGLQMLTRYEAPAEVHGFVRGRDIVTNASQHLGKDVVLRTDLRDFFGSIDRTRVTGSLVRHGFSPEAAEAVAGLVLVDNKLAQGFSTSSILSNLVFTDTDDALRELALGRNIAFTRYVDDLTFSGGSGAVHDDFLVLLTAVLEKQGWEVNARKTRFMRRGKPQYVTGLYVGDPDGPHIPRSMKRLLRREIYFAGKFGLEDARRRSPTPIRHDRLNGWVHYAAHADPVVGASLRADWNGVESRRYFDSGHKPSLRLLELIDFPLDW